MFMDVFSYGGAVCSSAKTARRLDARVSRALQPPLPPSADMIVRFPLSTVAQAKGDSPAPYLQINDLRKVSERKSRN
jgi:hypothetical protein